MTKLRSTSLSSSVAIAGAALALSCGGDTGNSGSGALLPPVGVDEPLIPDESEPGATPTDSEVVVGDPQTPGELPVDGTTPALNEENACEAVSSQAEGTQRPMDIIVVIDNSGSMDDEIAAVERNINVNFAAILDASGIDYRVIMVSAYREGGELEVGGGNGGGGGGNLFRVCVEEPLGPSACESRTAADSPHSERFFHFDQPVWSTDGPCLLLDTVDGPPVETSGRGNNTLEPIRGDDPVSQAGWSAHLREDSFKAFIMISDDTVECEVGDLEFDEDESDDFAEEFDAALRSAAPQLFGATPEDRRYSWHSIVGLEQNGAMDAVYEATDPTVDDTCESAQEAGEPHQALTQMTLGLRYPVCNTDSYDSIFQRIATEVVDGAALPCSWAIPTPPEGQVFDKDRVNLAYTPGTGAAAPALGRVDNADACATSLGWYYDDPAAPTMIHACPAACETFTSDDSGRVDLLFGCATEAPILR